MTLFENGSPFLEGSSDIVSIFTTCLEIELIIDVYFYIDLGLFN